MCNSKLLAGHCRRDSALKVVDLSEGALHTTHDVKGNGSDVFRISNERNYRKVVLVLLRLNKIIIVCPVTVFSDSVLDAYGLDNPDNSALEGRKW